MRISSAAALLLLAGCSGGTGSEQQGAAPTTGLRIECATGGARSLDRKCVAERSEGDRVTLRHDDGGFRRLTLHRDGSVDTADGADGVIVERLEDGRRDVIVGIDRYRLPATL